MIAHRNEPLRERIVRETAEHYRAEGYAVAAGDQLDHLPDFLNGYRPDLLARNAEESVVVEVRQRDQLAGDHELKRLPGLVENRSGWRFDLVLFDAKASSDEFAEFGRQPQVQEIQTRVAQADRMLVTGNWEAAHLVAWSAAEAVIRELVRDCELDEAIDPLSMLTKLAYDGHVSQAEYSRLRDALRERNALAHGRVVTPNPGSTAELLRFVTAHMPSEMSL